MTPESPTSSKPLLPEVWSLKSWSCWSWSYLKNCRFLFLPYLLGERSTTNILKWSQEREWFSEPFRLGCSTKPWPHGLFNPRLYFKGFTLTTCAGRPAPSRWPRRTWVPSERCWGLKMDLHKAGILRMTIWTLKMNEKQWIEWFFLIQTDIFTSRDWHWGLTLDHLSTSDAPAPVSASSYTCLDGRSHVNTLTGRMLEGTRKDHLGAWLCVLPECWMMF